MAINLTVNGKAHSVDVSPDTPLLWVLRDNLKLTGTKYGCGIGQCRACTVHLNGQAVPSCQIPASSLANAHVTTIEGLSADGNHPLQQAWIAMDVPQCGYCQAGQIMSAAALLNKHPHPSEDEIDLAMNQNLCRCGTYLRVRKAIQQAAGTASHAELFPITTSPLAGGE
jgi:aerobic-type carbon monoxide dehydrogenase small subunit (CoxS/CutS family)